MPNLSCQNLSAQIAELRLTISKLDIEIAKEKANVSDWMIVGVYDAAIRAIERIQSLEEDRNKAIEARQDASVKYLSNLS